MNWDQIEGNWKQLKGQAQERWGELTNDELDEAAGQALRAGEIIRRLREFATRPVDDDIARQLLQCVTFVEADPKDPPSP